FQALLARYSGQRVVAVGTPIANRRWGETEDLIGLFVNTLVMCTDLGGEPCFDELTARVREVVLDSHAHQDLPFEKLVEELQPQRDPSSTPLFQAMLAFHDAPPAVELGGLRIRPFRVEAAVAKFDLVLFLDRGESGLSGILEYRSELFDTTTMGRLARQFETLLGAVTTRPETPISSLELLRPGERAQVLTEWNDTVTPYPRTTPAHRLF
ncbi:MAG: non-ribosomal peptide synthetase, partial [Gemmatimonadetes bacterium]|nr:non-ribosomal peptide synthetase [Gemmatimonadota bacterium]NIV25104.1 non-ribosomal peptide synthetase [Gemmatimonadota bacterium]NIW74342.1 non-ribosomal peptide synthetase [Gemmatimonadota bacterium]